MERGGGCGDLKYCIMAQEHGDYEIDIDRYEYTPRCNWVDDYSVNRTVIIGIQLVENVRDSFSVTENLVN